jgi:hypothetical protein
VRNPTSAPFTEDALVRVAHDAKVGAVAAPSLQEAELRGVDVLELVDEQVAEAPPLTGRELAIGFERLRAHEEEIVEVDETAPALLVLVSLEDRRDGCRGQRWRATEVCRLPLVLIGTDHASLGPLDLCCDIDRLHGGALRAGEQWREEAHLAFEQRRGPLATIGPPAPELPVREGMEGARRDLVADAERVEADRKLTGSLARERDDEHVTGVRRAVPHPPGHPPGQHSRLARARSRQDAQRRCFGDHGLALGRIETVEDRRGGVRRHGQERTEGV